MNSGKKMTQQLKTQKKKRVSHSQADPRLVELIKYLARHAAERDYNEIQSFTAMQKDSHEDAGEDS
jgi:hypothetical protein